jgi:hypothetical protein
LHPNGDEGIRNYMETTLLQYVTVRMLEAYGILSIPHGDFMDVREPARGWVPLEPQPRYLSNYVGLRNRLAILNEQYPYAEFETRVRGAYSLFLTFLDHLHENKDAVVELVRTADRRAVDRGADPGEADGIVVEYSRAAIDERLTIRGYEMEIVTGSGGSPRGRPTERTVAYTDVPYYSRYNPKRTVPLPRGYLIAVRDEAVIEKLMQHGITVEQLVEPVTATVESFSVTGVTPARRLNQGHYTSSVEGEYATQEREFPVGTYYVSTAQSLGTLAAYMLEPESDDGLVVWNFFDRYLAMQWSDAPQTYPVFKVFQPLHNVKQAISPVPVPAAGLHHYER